MAKSKKMKITLILKVWLVYVGGVLTGAIDSWWWLIPSTLTAIWGIWIYETYERKNGKD